ncbi:MAG: class I SAM-dependent rRNA methyltransferase [Acidimicrobiales bacterium]|jgi:23S rRNA (cytosine1962-C5)-methyltransferase
MVNLEAELPAPSSERIAVHVTNDALRQIRGGHPWVWDGSIVRASAEGTAGDLAVIFDDKRKFAAIGLWDPNAPIAVRILHQGAPLPIDAAFFADKLLTAFARRQTLQDDNDTTAFRLVHGENDGLPGLVVDRYDNTLVVKLDSPVWVPHLTSIIEPLVELTDAERVVLRASRRIIDELPPFLSDSPTVFGKPPAGPIKFFEHGLQFEADVERGQKTGHFLDQRDNRQLVGTRCEGAHVLDVFCNTGGFSVYAAAGGARSVHSIDVSPHAIEATQRHIEINRSGLGYDVRHTSLVADAFDAMEDLVDRHQHFDVIIIDPPSFAPNSASVPAARRAYRRLTSLAVDLLANGGTLVQASCSSRIATDEFYALVTGEIAESGHKAIHTIRTGHALDHPIGFEQGAYLKAILADVVPATRSQETGRW